MRKIITYLLLSYGIITASFAQQDSTLLLLDKTEITTGVFTVAFVIQEEHEVSSTQKQ